MAKFTNSVFKHIILESLGTEFTSGFIPNIEGWIFVIYVDTGTHPLSGVLLTEILMELSYATQGIINNFITKWTYFDVIYCGMIFGLIARS